MDSVFRDRSSRATFIKNAAAVGAGLALFKGFDFASGTGLKAEAASDSVGTIISTALIAEQLATTFYYTGLTSKAVMSSNQLAGSSGDVNNIAAAPNGNRGNVHYLQAGLDAEIKHAAALAKAGAMSSFSKFYFPASTFEKLGSPSDAGSFLGVLDALETAFVGAYLAAINEFVTLGHPDLAELAGEIMGVEAEHRALGRVIAKVNPANNLTLEKAPFTAVSQAGGALKPFLTGQGFSGGATPALALPLDVLTIPLIGSYTTRVVTMFL